MSDVCIDNSLADNLYQSLSTGVLGTTPVDSDSDFNLPSTTNSILANEPVAITIDTLTNGRLDGTGVFDKMMSAVDVHLKTQVRQNHVSKDQYAKMYSQALTDVLNNASNFALAMQKAQWDSIEAQMRARASEIDATKAKVDLAKAKIELGTSTYDMYLSGARYCLTVREAAKAKFELDNILPVKLAQEQLTLNCIMPAQKSLITAQAEKENAHTSNDKLDGLNQVSGVLGFQLNETLPAQLDILREQREAERAKTLDARSDGAIVTGSMGKQKELYDEQISSFDKDAKFKAAKLYSDSWITQKTLDEGLLAPNQFTNTNIDSVMTTLKNVNQL